jgi:23S rRNA (uracil1939-C5)-methyltransferase
VSVSEAPEPAQGRAPDRQQPSDSPPECRHARDCPGCPLIARPYAEGLRLKAGRIEAALQRYPELSGIRVEPVLGAASITDYRVRAKLVVDPAGQLGLFAAGSHRVVDTPGCRILAPALHAAAAALRTLLPLEIPLAGVDLRASDAGVLLCLIVEGQVTTAALERSAQRVWRQVPGLVSLAASVHEPGAVQLLGQNLRVLRGPEAARHHLGAAEPWHYASHGAFTQVHPEQTRRLHERLEQALVQRFGALSGCRVLELYAGSGALALRLAARGARVCAVESFAPALARLAEAASAQGLAVETRALAAEEFLAGRSATAPEFDVLIVNPPRRGLSPAVRSALAGAGARLLAYVSCEPQTLARDLEHFRQQGWAAARLAPFDLIPLSEAVESLVLLEPGAVPAARVLFEDEHSLALDKLPFEPTTPQGESSSSLLERARSTLALPELTPVHRLDRGTSGVCWFARRPELVAPLARALEQGQKSYLGLVRGITRSKGKIVRPLREAGKLLAATTRYRRRSVIAGHSLLELWPEHGRKHQLRRHLSSIGHPILGDERYGQASANRHFEHRHGLDRTFLHCASVRLELGATEREVRAELPGDLQAVLDSLGAAGSPQSGQDHSGGHGNVQ